jgi:hypothetical protein
LLPILSRIYTRRPRPHALHLTPACPARHSNKRASQRSPLSRVVLAQGGAVDNEAAAGVVLGSRRGGVGAAGSMHGGGGGGARVAEAQPAPARAVGGAGLRRVRGGAVGGGRIVPALRRGAVPLHPQRVRLRQVRPPRQGVPQVPVAARPALRTAKVRFVPSLAGDDRAINQFR